VAVVETFVLTHRHGLERMKLHRLKRERQIAAITLIQVRISATVLPSVDFLPSANPRKWLEMLSRNDWPRNIHKSSPTGTICDHDSEALSTIHC
jgi:hypothetical protein